MGRFKATQEPYLGVIWYSPGGPGQSGSGLIYEAGPPLSLATGGQYVRLFNLLDLTSRNPTSKYLKS